MYCVLWKAKGVAVKFGFDRKTIVFYLSYNYKNYKLEISYESRWEVQLHRPPAHRSRTKFLLIQVGSVQVTILYTLAWFLLGVTFSFIILNIIN
jgi:hypothetical protein